MNEEVGEGKETALRNGISRNSSTSTSSGSSSGSSRSMGKTIESGGEEDADINVFMEDDNDSCRLGDSERDFRTLLELSIPTILM